MSPLGEAMDPPVSSGRRVRTGLFEIDLGSSEMHKEGRRVPLQEQPFRVLALLVERPGEVVTREELQRQLWPADTYVGFDEGLNTAIRKLRIALGDSPENPRFIETIPRRGYRFVAPVQEAIVEAPRAPGSAEGAGPAVEMETDGPRQTVPLGGLGVPSGRYTRRCGRRRVLHALEAAVEPDRPHASDAGDPAFRESEQ